MQLGGGEGEPGEVGPDAQVAHLGLAGPNELEDGVASGAIEVSDLPDRSVALELGDPMGDVAADEVDVLERVSRLGPRAIASREGDAEI